MIIADTSGLLAYFNDSDADHHAVVDALRGYSTEALVVSPYVVAELDYVLATRAGVDKELTVLTDLAGGAYELADFGADDLAKTISVIERYRDQNIGVTDASLVVLAQRYETRTILTLDRRHFDVVRPLKGGRFKVLPA